MAASFRYSRWDGTQVGFDLDADEVLSQITDDLLYHGDLHAALRRMLQSGMHDRDGRHVAGVQELLEQLRRRRREELGRYDLGGVYDDIAGELREVLDQERRALDDLAREAAASGDRRRQEITEEVTAERGARLDMLPPDLAGQVRALSDYDFTSSDARERFEALVDKLRQQLLAGYFNRMSGALSDVSPEHLQRTKDMLAGLNAMLEQRARGEEPDFAGFMERFGDFFPGEPSTLDELLEQMAEQMAAMQALRNSMTPEQRSQLAGLAEALLGDIDLRWQVDELARHLQQAFPQAGWDRSYQLTGSDPLGGLAEAAQLMDRLGDIDGLEQLLRSAATPGALAEVDLDAARDLLGDDAARSLERLAELARMLEEAGLIQHREGRLELTPRGMRRIGRNALADLFTRLDKDRAGRHPVERAGVGRERTYETKPYEFGDPFDLSIERTVRNAVRRSGRGVPVSLSPEDFEVERTDTLTRSSTVLMLDLSLSMPMRDNFLAAKKVAMALHALIQMQFPRDYLGIVGFSEVAREIRAHELPEVSWDFVFGTNMQHALLLARRMLSRQSGTRQILMITDGEPTAHVLPGGEVFFNYPPLPETIEATLGEVARCTREGIRINTFVLDATGELRGFVERLTRLNRGRAFFTTPETLGDYVLVDFIDQKRSLRGRPARPRAV